jgi:hypothetical protein
VAILRIDEVIVGVGSEIDLHPVDLAVEFTGHQVVVRTDHRARLVADVGGFVGREDQGLGPPDPTGADLVTVAVEGDVAALAEPSAVVGELRTNLMGPLGDRAV